MHLDDERIQRFLDGELGADDRALVLPHVGECAACRDRLAAARGEEARLAAGLRLIDHPVPAAAPPRLVRQRLAPAGGLRWAAAVALLLGAAGVAYAIPGSPLRRWIAAVVRRAPTLPARPVPEATPEPARPSGVAVAPGRVLVVAFELPGGGSRAAVVLTDGADVVVEAESGKPAFSTEPGRLVVRSTEPGTFAIRIPRRAPRVEIRSDGRRVFSISGGVATVPPDSTGGWTVVLVP